MHCTLHFTAVKAQARTTPWAAVHCGDPFLWRRDLHVAVSAGSRPRLWGAADQAKTCAGMVQRHMGGLMVSRSQLPQGCYLKPGHQSLLRRCHVDDENSIGCLGDDVIGQAPVHHTWYGGRSTNVSARAPAGRGICGETEWTLKVRG